MTVDPVHLTSSYDNVDRTSYTAASVSPTASRWLVIDVGNAGTAPVATPTVSGLSLTWVQEITGPYGANARRITRFYAWTGATPGSGAITISFGASTQTGCAWIVYELGVDADTSDPFVQSAAVDSAVGTSAEVTLAAFASANNRPLICAGHNVNEGSTPETGYTEIADVSGSAVGMGFAAAFHPSATDTTPSYSWATSATIRGAIASEIKAATVGAARPPGALARMGVG